MEGFPSGQREQTVNLSSMTSVVRIHHLPPKEPILIRVSVLFWCQVEWIRKPTLRNVPVARFNRRGFRRNGSESTTGRVGTRVAVRLYDGTRRNAPLNHPVAAKVRCISSPNNLAGTELPFRSTDFPVCPNRESGSPYPDGKFYRRSRRGLPRSRREQKGRDTHGFPSSLNSYLSFWGARR